MKRWRGLAVAAALLLLGGCWTGRSFYTSADAVQPIRPGQYRVVAQVPASEPSEINVGEPVSIRSDDGGATVIEDKDGRSTLFLAKVPDAPDRHVAQDADQSGTDEEAWFWLYAVEGDTVRVSLPSCDKTYRMARKAGAVVTKSASGRECHFPNRVSLEAAMARYAKRPDNWIEIQRVGD
jgi:hypothetical protein